MSAQALEIFLARLYSDSAFRSQFEKDPDAAFNGMDLAEVEKDSLRVLDRSGLHLAARSYAHKRAHRSAK